MRAGKCVHFWDKIHSYLVTQKCYDFPKKGVKDKIKQLENAFKPLSALFRKIDDSSRYLSMVFTCVPINFTIAEYKSDFEIFFYIYKLSS